MNEDLTLRSIHSNPEESPEMLHFYSTAAATSQIVFFG